MIRRTHTWSVNNDEEYLEAMLTEFPSLAATEAQGTFDAEM